MNTQDRARKALRELVEGEVFAIHQARDMYGFDRARCKATVERILAALPPRPADDVAKLREALRTEIINAPETADFMAGVPIEAAHQRERWGANHDAGKTPEDWFWLIGYLGQKALRAQNAGDTDKALHHTISTAAALANWHAAIAGIDTSMRPGIDPPTAIRALSQDGGERK